MNLIVNPETTDFHCSLVFAEPQIELAGEERRFPLIRQVMKRFLIRLNDIRFNVNSPSNDYLHFSRFYGQAYLDVSFGLEEIEVWFRRIESENQLLEVLSDFFEVIKGISVSIQRMALHQHFSSEGDVQGFLNSIIPNHPEAFGGYLTKKGVFYTLRAEEHNSTIHIMAAESFFVQGGLYLSIESEFAPNNYESQDALKIAREHNSFVLSGLGIQTKET